MLQQTTHQRLLALMLMSVIALPLGLRVFQAPGARAAKENKAIVCKSLKDGTQAAANADRIVDDSWRRTSLGWERKEDWLSLTRFPDRRPLTMKTLLQRTWPATVAATELILVLAILFIQPRITE